MNPKNTPHQLKRLLGKKFSDPAVQADIARLPFKVSEGPDGGCLVHVTFCSEPASFSPEQLMAMVLTDLKKIAEAETGIAVTDCAISVPTFYTEVERYAMLNAASVAGLNCLRLVNETTATALAYGIFKTDLPDTDPVHVGFVDVGHAHTQVGRSSTLGPARAAGPGPCRTSAVGSCKGRVWQPAAAAMPGGFGSAAAAAAGLHAEACG
jgi:heat shock protein 4